MRIKQNGFIINNKDQKVGLFTQNKNRTFSGLNDPYHKYRKKTYGSHIKKGIPEPADFHEAGN
jgi:hypothetical protein